MVPDIRKAYNECFTKEKYETFLKDINNVHPDSIDFRIAETPIFINKSLKHQILEACENIVDTILKPNFKALTNKAIPENVIVPNENDHSHFIAFDFGICVDKKGNYIPQLIEMQGFPSLFAYQILFAEITEKHFNIPKNYSTYLNDFTKETYIELLKNIILNNHKPENVVLLEIFPAKQKTRVDFMCTKDYIGIETICLTELKADGNNLFYEKNGKKIDIKRIYNRIIFDDLQQQKLPAGTIDITKNWNVEWCPHPNWFYRISKYTLPLIDSPYVPKTQYLSDVKELPKDLENYVLKPLFSFAGQGVIIDIQPDDIQNIKDPHNWILQQKVQYADVIQTPDIPAKAEIRIFYFWENAAERPIATNNLVRLSKGKMVGVRYNADKEWVGSSLAYFKKD